MFYHWGTTIQEQKKGADEGSIYPESMWRRSTGGLIRQPA